MERIAFLLLCLIAVPALAQPAESYSGFYLGLKPISADINYEEADGLPFGAGATIGYAFGRAALEYEPARVLSLDVGAHFASAFTPPGAATEAEDAELTSHGLFLTYRAGDWAFVKIRGGYRYLRIEEEGRDHALLDEDRGAAGGIGVGLRGRHVMLELDYTVLERDFKYYGLGLSLVF